MNFNERMQPNTLFLVVNSYHMDHENLERINDFYVPLVDSDVIMTYIHLNQSYKIFNNEIVVHRFKDILDALNQTLSGLNRIIEKLEAIGLLRSYITSDSNDSIIYYEILKPMKPNAFLSHPMYSLYLYNQIGDYQFQRLKEKYDTETIPENAIEITKSFNEVFETMQQKDTLVTDIKFPNTLISEGPKFNEDLFDFNVLFTHLNGTKVDKRFFNNEVKQLIVELSQLFNLNAYDMKQIILKVVQQYRMIDLEGLKREARMYYQSNLTPPQSKQFKASSQSDGEDYFSILDRLNPVERLKKLKNNQPSDSNYKLIVDLMTTTSLSNGVINILIEYVFQVQDGELPVPYVMKIAKDWESKGYKTAKEAYDSIINMKKNREKKQGRLSWMDNKQQTSNTFDETKEIQDAPKRTMNDDPELKKMMEDLN